MGPACAILQTRQEYEKQPSIATLSGKDDLAREIFLSWYSWYCEKLESIVSGPAGTLDKLREIVRHEFSAPTDYSEAFVYFARMKPGSSGGFLPES